MPRLLQSLTPIFIGFQHDRGAKHTATGHLLPSATLRNRQKLRYRTKSSYRHPPEQKSHGPGHGNSGGFSEADPRQLVTKLLGIADPKGFSGECPKPKDDERI